LLVDRERQDSFAFFQHHQWFVVIDMDAELSFSYYELYTSITIQIAESAPFFAMYAFISRILQVLTQFMKSSIRDEHYITTYDAKVQFNLFMNGGRNKHLKCE
jgi:hypothetical protein